MGSDGPGNRVSGNRLLVRNRNAHQPRFSSCQPHGQLADSGRHRNRHRWDDDARRDLESVARFPLEQTAMPSVKPGKSPRKTLFGDGGSGPAGWVERCEPNRFDPRHSGGSHFAALHLTHPTGPSHIPDAGRPCSSEATPRGASPRATLRSPGAFCPSQSCKT
jgi:hypothetical protein